MNTDPTPDLIRLFLHKYLTPEGFGLWSAARFPYVWDKPVSSSGKYHKRNGYIPTIGQHTLRMLHNGQKISSATGYEPKSKEMDMFLIAIAIHDIYKYGYSGTKLNSDHRHDEMMAHEILNTREYWAQNYDDDQINILFECVLYQHGRWSNAKNLDEGRCDASYLLHFLDMADTHNVNFMEDPYYDS